MKEQLWLITYEYEFFRNGESQGPLRETIHVVCHTGDELRKAADRHSESFYIGGETQQSRRIKGITKSELIGDCFVNLVVEL